MKVIAKERKPIVLEAITFDELVEHGRNSGATEHGGFPWSFEYKGEQISHENNSCFLIPNHLGTDKMTPDDMLITGASGMLFCMSIAGFNDTYEEVKEDTAKILDQWCMCTKLEGVARDGKSTCSICGGIDAYGTSKDRPEKFKKVL